MADFLPASPFLSHSTDDVSEDPSQLRRGFGGALKDVGLDVARSTVGIGRDVTSLGRDVAGEGGYWEAADKAARATEDYLGKQKTPVGQAIDTGQQGFFDRPAGYIAHELAQFAPWMLVGHLAAGAGAALGPAGAVGANAGLWAGMGVAEYRKSVREIADQTPRERLDQLPQFQELMKTNNGNEKEARNELYHNMLSVKDQLISGAAGAVAGLPLAGAKGGLVGALREAGVLGVGLGAQTAAGAYGQQSAEVQAGLRERIDAAPIIDQGAVAALTGMAGGFGLGAMRSRRPPPSSEFGPAGRSVSPATGGVPATSGDIGAIDTRPPVPSVAPDHAAALEASFPRATKINPSDYGAEPERVQQGEGDLTQMPEYPGQYGGHEEPPPPPPPPAPPAAPPPAEPAPPPTPTAPAGEVAPGARVRRAAGVEAPVQGGSEPAPAPLEADLTAAPVVAAPVSRGKATVDEVNARRRGATAAKRDAARAERDAAVEAERATRTAELEAAQKAEDELNARRGIPLPEGSATARGVSENVPERPGARIFKDANFVGRNAEGLAVWERPTGTKERLVLSDDGKLTREGKRSADAPRDPMFDVPRGTRVFDIAPTRDTAQRRQTFNQRIAERWNEMRREEEGAAQKIRHEDMAGHREDIVEGRMALDVAEEKGLPQQQQKARQLLTDASTRNLLARLVIKEYTEHDNAGVPISEPLDARAARVADKNLPMTERMQALREMADQLRELQTEIQKRYDEEPAFIRQQFDRIPRVKFELTGSKGRENFGLWHNFATQVASIVARTDSVLARARAAVNPASQQGLMVLRAQKMMELDRLARRGEEGMQAANEDRLAASQDQTAKRKPTGGTEEVERLSNEQMVDMATEGGTQRARRTPPAPVEPAPAVRTLSGAELVKRVRELNRQRTRPPTAAEIEERDRLNEDRLKLAERQTRRRETRSDDRPEEDKPIDDDKTLATMPIRGDRDPGLTDEEISRLRERSAVAADAIEHAQNVDPLSYEANKEALTAVVDAADTLRMDSGEDTPLADALIKYLRQVIENQKKGMLFGRDVVATVDKGLAMIFKAYPDQFVTTQTAGEIIDHIISDPARTPNDVLRNLFLGRFRHLAADVPVTILGPEAFDSYAALHKLVDPAAIFNATTRHIVAREDALKGTFTAEILGHEIGHAVAFRTLENDAPLRDGMEMLRNHLVRKLGLQNADLRATENRKVYGLASIHEMMSEAWNNADFQDMLSRQLLTTSQWKDLGLPPQLPAQRSVWQGLVSMISRALGMNKIGHTALDAVMQMTERLDRQPRADWDLGSTGQVRATLRKVDEANDSGGSRAVLDRIERVRTLSPGTSRTWLGVHAFTDLVKRGTETYQAVTRPIYTAVAKMHDARDRYLEEFKIRDLMKNLATFERTNKAEAPEFRNFLVDATIHGAHPDVPLSDARNKHISEEGLGDEQTRQQHEAMRTRYNALTPNAKKLYHELAAKARSMNLDEVSRQALRGYFETMGDAGELAMAKAKTVMEEKLTDPEKALVDAERAKGQDAFDRMVNEAKTTPEFRQVKGPYFPLMRHGQWAVRGMYDLADHVEQHKGKLVGDSNRIAEFTDEDQAKAYIKAVSADLGIAQQTARSLLYDTRSGEPLEGTLDRKTAEALQESGGVQRRFQVTMNPDHLQFFDRKGDARRAIKDLQESLTNGPMKDKPFTVVADPEAVREPEANVGPNYMSPELTRITKRILASEAYQNLPQHRQTALKQAIEDAGARSMLRTGISARMLPRQLTKGASTDLLRNYAEFFSSTANYMGRLEHQRELDVALKNAEQYVGDFRNQEGHDLRHSVLEEIKRRVNQRPQIWSGNVLHDAINRILGASYLDKLMSPGFLAVNSTEPMLLGIPMIGMRHGGIKAAGALMSAYRAVGAAGMWAQGGKDFAKAIASKDPLTHWVNELRTRLGEQPDGERLQQLVDHVSVHGLMNRNAMMEIERAFAPEANHPTIGGRALDYADNAFRQLNTAVENVNRAVTAVAAYRLEYQRGLNPKGKETRLSPAEAHEKAMKYAEAKLEETAGNYAAYNAPPVFNRPVLRLALQFKKYPQRVLANYFRLMVGGAKGNPEALRGLMLAGVAQTLVSGVLGLPTEPLKAVFTAGNVAGILPPWDTVEHEVRGFMTRNVGAGAGEVLSRGLPRYLGVDTGRLGHDSLLTFGTPPSTKPNDLRASLFNLVAGAPGGLAADFIQGIQDTGAAVGHYANGANAQGDQKSLEVARNILPIKTGADILDSFLRATNSRFTTMPSGAERQPKYGAGDMAIRSLGFTPGWEAEMGEARRYASEQKQIQQQTRSAVMKEWVRATPGERNAVWSSIDQWNQSQPQGQRILRGDLIKAQAQQGRQIRSTPTEDFGVRLGKRNQDVRQGLDVYNTH